MPPLCLVMFSSQPPNLDYINKLEYIQRREKWNGEGNMFEDKSYKEG